MKFKSKLWNKITLFCSLFVASFLLITFYTSPKHNFQQEVDPIVFGPKLPRYIFPANAERIEPDLMTLGRELYYDKRLSNNKNVSCNSCHQLDKYGVDNKPLSVGNQRNTPTVYYAAAHIAQSLDGRYPNVEEQAKASINPYCQLNWTGLAL